MPDVYDRSSSLPFLDQLEWEQREMRSARIEGREPDFSKANLNPMYHQEQEHLKEQEEALERTRAGRKLRTLELDMNDPASIAKAIEMLAQHKDNLELEGDTTPTSLVPGVSDPTIDNSVTPENVNVPVPTVPTGDTVASTEREPDNLGPDERDYEGEVNRDSLEPQKTPYPFQGDERIPSAQGRKGELVTQDSDDQQDKEEEVALPEFSFENNDVHNSTTPVAEDKHGIASAPDDASYTPADKRNDDDEQSDEDANS